MTPSPWHLWAFQPGKLLFKRRNQRNEKNIRYCWKGMSGLLSSKVRKKGEASVERVDTGLFIFELPTFFSLWMEKKRKSKPGGLHKVTWQVVGWPSVNTQGFWVLGSEPPRHNANWVLPPLIFGCLGSSWSLDSHSQMNTWEKLSLDLLCFIWIQEMNRRNGCCVVLFRLWCGFKQVEF